MPHPQEVNYLAGKEAPSSVLINYLWRCNYSEYGIASRISLVASSNFPSSGSFYRLFTRSSYVIITSLLAGEYGIVTVTLIGISRPRGGGNNSRMEEG